MAYKRYIKVGGKLFGPYYYESYRDKDGKVKSRYLEDYSEENKYSKFKKINLALIVILSIAFAFVFALSLSSNNLSVSEESKVLSSISSFRNFAYSYLSYSMKPIQGLLAEDEAVSEPVVEVPSFSPEEVVSEVPSEQPSETPAETPSETTTESTETEGTIVENQKPTEPTPIEEQPIETPTETPVETPIEQPSETPIGSTPAIEQNQSIDNSNELITNETIITETTDNQTTTETTENIPNIISENLSIISETSNISSEISLTNISLNITFSPQIVVKQYRAVINKPVKWIKYVNATPNSNLDIEIPKQASDIVIKTGDEAEQALLDYEKDESNSSSLITGFAISETDSNLFNSIINFFKHFTLTGRAISGNELTSISETEDAKIVEVSQVIGNENEVAIEYYTDAPISTEIETERGKQIIISADDEFGYTDVLAYSELTGDLQVSMNEISKLKLLWKNENQYVNFSYYDLDENGNADYIEWIVPHLSNQSYEIIIEISNAEHLDENKIFIEDVYNSVSSIDNLSATIPSGNYLRVKFETNLSSERDITIYAFGNNSRVEVYEKNGNEIIASFENVNDYQMYKIYLTNLVGEQDEFDLKSIGDVQYDYVIDPNYPAGFSGLCYQETANASSALDGNCGLNYGGNYSFFNPWTSPKNTYDSDWGTYGYSAGITGGTAAVYINYSKPLGAKNTSLWQVKDGVGIANLSIDESCWNYDPNVLVLSVYTTFSGGIDPCIDGDSLIKTPNGSKKIKDLQIGDEVLSFNNGILEKDYVSSVIIKNISLADNFYYYIYTSDSNLVKATWNHKFYSEGNWVQAKDLIVGQHLLNYELAEVDIVEIEKVPYFGETWDIVVEKNHNFFANNILVHNPASYDSTWYCYNGTLSTLRTNSNTNLATDDIYEEAMWWDISQADSNVVYACGNITAPGTYTMNQSISLNSLNANCLEINSSNVVLDCNYSQISISSNSGFYHIYAANVTNITIKNCPSLYSMSGDFIGFTNVNNSFIYNISDGGSGTNGLIFSYSNYNIIQNVSLTGQAQGISISNSNYNNFSKMDIKSTSVLALFMISSSNNLFSNSTFNTSGVTNIVSISGTSSSNVFSNVNISAVSGYSCLSDSTNLENYLIYENSFGKIVWAKSNLTLYNGIYFSKDVIIMNNSAYLNSSNFGDNINSSANVSLYNLPTNFANPVILKDGVQCTNCYNFTSLNAGTVIFNVSSWSNYSIGEGSSSDTTAPSINFTAPTPASGTTQTSNAIYVNVTSNDTNQHSTFVNFDNSLVAWWRGEGNANDYFGVYNGSLVLGAVANANGKYGQAFGFDGIDDKVSLYNYSVNLKSSNRTISLWVNISSTGNTESIIDDWSGVGTEHSTLIRVTSAGVLQYYILNSDHTQTGGTISDAISFNAWHYLVFVNNASGLYAYVDGIKTSYDLTWTGTINSDGYCNPPACNNFSLGAYQPYNGTIDDVMIFNRSLSTSEILALYNASTSKYYNNFTNLAEGAHIVKAYSQDTSGNINSTETRTIIIDTTAPSINFTAPTPSTGTQTSNAIFVNVTSSDVSQHSTFVNFDNSIVAWWRMDDVNSSGDVVDYFGRFNGTKYGNAVQNSSGKFNSSFSFDGSGDYIDLANSTYSNLLGSFTVCTWIYPNTMGGNNLGTILDNYVSTSGGFDFLLRTAGSNTRSIQLSVAASGGQETLAISVDNAITLGVWQYVCTIFNSSSLKGSFYINGNSINLHTDTPGITRATNIYPLRIGDHYNAVDRSFNGSIDEILIFNRTLSSSEILALYNASTSKYYNNFTNLADGQHTVKAYSQDTSGNINMTETRTITIQTPDTTPPAINFTAPTPASGIQTSNAIFVNVTSNDTNQHSTFVNFDNSLVVWWRAEGNANDYFGRFNGTLQGNANATSPGKFNSSFGFDGSGDYVNLDGAAATVKSLTQGTVSFWAKRAYRGVCLTDGTSTWDNYCVNMEDVYIKEGNSVLLDCSADSSINTSDWNQMTYVVNSSGNFIYINGALTSVTYSTGSASSKYFFNTTTAATALRIGEQYIRDDPTYAGFTNGTIDDIMIFNRSLSASEVASLYNASTSKYYNNFTNLADGAHTIKAYSQDTSGNINTTETRTITIQTPDTTAPSINFTAPTPASGTTQTSNAIYVNVTSNDTNQHSTFVNFDNSLVAWWRMDDTNSSGDVVDYFGRYNGTKYGNAVQNSSGKFNSSFSFDGNGDYINITHTSILMPSEKITISMWINPAAQQLSNNVLSKMSGDTINSGYAFSYDNSEAGKLRFLLHNGALRTVTTTNALPSNIWTHIVGTYNGSSVKLYSNGVETGSSITTTGGITPSSYNLVIGAYMQYANSYNFNGSIDDILIFNRSLNSSEILALYNASTNKYYNNFTNLADGAHTIKAYSQDTSGNINMTETRTITIQTPDTTPPAINFTAPTPASGTTQTSNAIYVNVTSNDTNQHSTFVNFDNSVVWIRMDDTNSSGDVVDYFKIYNGTKIGNAVQNSSGKFNSSFSFDGNGDQLNILSGYPSVNILTVSVWFKTIASSRQVIFNMANQLPPNTPSSYVPAILVQTDGKIRAELWTGSVNSVTSSSSYNDGNWHHAILNSKGDSYSLYLDGVLQGSVNGNVNNAWWSSTSLGAGYDTVERGASSTSIYYFNGSIDDFIIFNRSISINETLSLYSNQSQRYLSFNNSLADGTHTIKAYSQDTSGNINMTETRTITINSDVTPPAINFISPTNITYSLTNNITLSLQSDSTNQTIWWYNGTLNQTYIPTILNLVNGQYSFRAYANDSSNNINSTSVTFVVNYCSYQNTSLSDWTNLSCASNQMNQSRYLVQYDSLGCGYTNVTFYEYQLVSSIWKNTTYTDWTSGVCSGNDLNKSRNLTQYDVFGCSSNQTFFDYNLSTANLTYSEWGDWTNLSCASNQMNQSRNRTQFDSNILGCFSNITVYEYQLADNEVCNATSLAISLTSPSNGTSTTSTTNDFVYNISSSHTILNCSLNLNNVNYPNSSYVNSSLSDTITVSGLTVGNYYWNISCYNSRISNFSETRLLTITSLPATTTTTTTTSSSGGGGGGGAAPARSEYKDIFVDTTELTIDMLIKSEKIARIKITNNGTKNVDVPISQTGLDGILITDNKISLAAGETKILKLVFNSLNETTNYVGKLLVDGRTVLISVNIKSTPLLFDSSIVVPDTNKIITLDDGQTEKLKTQVTLLPMGEKPRVDVTLHYTIKDFNGRIYLQESETLLVDNQKTFGKDFYVDNLPEGDYVIAMEMIYPNGVATSSSHFIISKPKALTPISLIIGLSLIVIALLISTSIVIIRYKKLKSQLLRK